MISMVCRSFNEQQRLIPCLGGFGTSALFTHVLVDPASKGPPFFGAVQSSNSHSFAIISASQRTRATVYDIVYITPSWGGFPSSIARQPRGCHSRTIRLRKALGEIFPTPTFFGTDTTPPVEIPSMEKSAQEGVT